MNFILQPWHFLLACLVGWINREQQKIVDYLITENRILKEKFGKKRILLNDDQRRRLALKGKSLGRKVLKEIETIFSPDTILRWHKQLVAQKWDYTDRRREKSGRPRIRQAIVDLVVRLAKENPSWGYKKIKGALENVGCTIAKSTIAAILKSHGIEPAPDRGKQTTWRVFLKAHWDSLGAIDFTTIEVWTKGGLVTYYLLFVIKVSTRRVHFAGCTPHPNSPWMEQIARNLTDPFDGFLLNIRHLLMDRDRKFCETFRQSLKREDVNCKRLPPRSPNLTPHIERFMRTIKEECLAKMIFFSEHSLRKAILEFCEHYHKERNHQGLNNSLIEPGEEVGKISGTISCHERLGGMLRYYYRDAA